MNCFNCLRSMIRLGVEKGTIVWFCVVCERIAKGESHAHQRMVRPEGVIYEREV
jgi:hypothetical protein